MKITILLTDISNDGGVQNVVKNFVNQLHNDIEKISIVSVFKTNKSDKIIDEIQDKCEITYIYEGSRNFKKIYFNLLINLKKHFRSNDSDIVIGCGLFYAPFLSVLGKHYTKMIWSHSAYSNIKFMSLNWIGKIFSYIFMDKIISITKKDFFNFNQDLFLRKKEKVVMIYNFNENNYSNYFSGKSKTILSIGTIDYIKGFDYIVDIGKEIFNNYKEWKWIIVGDGPLLNKMREQIKEHNLENNVFFVGYKKDISTYLKSSDIFVLTSRSEGFGLVTLEAKMAGIPVVGFSCKGITSEIITSNINGFIVEDNNIDEMKGKITKLLNDPNLRKKFSKNTILYNEEFDSTKIKSEWLKLINKSKGR